MNYKLTQVVATCAFSPKQALSECGAPAVGRIAATISAQGSKPWGIPLCQAHADAVREAIDTLACCRIDV